METINQSRIIRNFFSMSFVQGITALFQLIVVPYVISKTGIENFGKIAVAQVVMYSLATIAEYGYAQYGTKQVALNRHNTSKLSEIFYYAVYTRIILTVVCLLILSSFLLIPFVQKNLLLYFFSYVFVPGQALLPFWFFQGMEKMHWTAFFTLLSKIIFVLLVFIFIQQPQDAVLYLLFMGVGNLVVAFVASLYIIKKYRITTCTFSFQQSIAILKENIPLTTSNLMMNFMQYGGLFILRLFSNDIVAGYFSVAERIYFAMKQVVAAFAQTIYPNICRCAMQGKTTLKNYLSKIFNPFWALTTLASILVIIFAPWIIHFFLPTHNTEAVFILRMLCIALPIVCSNIPGSLTLLALDKTKSYLSIYLLGFLIFIVANIILAAIFHIMGTLVAIYITEIFIAIGFTYLLMKALKNVPPENQ